ncbi:MAG TPA: histidine phosphatase family protein [Steroidobacteraceae bacterium]|nr:histidine phosphatase family protein [Steroidobacteraceae bacterium]
MTKILLVRHGHVEGIRPERFRGRHNVPLTERGILQARATGEYIAAHWQPSHIYTSPLQRCVQTGVEIATRCAASAEVLEELNDLDYGEWQWCTHEEVQARWPQEFDRWFKAPQWMRFPQGESLQDMHARLADALRLILQRHANKTVVLVAHDSSLRVLLLHLLDMPLAAYWRFAQDPCGVSEITTSARQAKALRINETQHLPQSPS